MIGFVLLSMWILHVYFSEQYLICYDFLKLAANSICIKAGVHGISLLRAHRPVASEPLMAGPRGHVGARGPQASLNRGARARGDAARRRRRLAGATGHGSRRRLAHSTRTIIAKHLSTAPPYNGHRRRSYSDNGARWRSTEQRRATETAA